MSNIYGRQVVEALVNKSGGGVIAGDVVIIDTSNNGAFTTSTAGAFTGMIGVAQETIASNATGRVLTAGYAALVNVNASVTRGNFGKSYTVAKQATDAGSSRIAGTFCQFLTGGTTPTAHVFGIADNTSGAGTGTVTTVKDEGVNLSTAVVSVDFVGAGVTASGTTAVTVTIPGGSGAMTQITQTVLSGSATDITFSGIAGSYETLMVVISGRTDRALATDNLRMQFNAAGGTAYDFDEWTSTGDSPTTGAASMNMGPITGDSATAGWQGENVIYIPGYARTTYHKVARANSYDPGSNKSASCGGVWHSTAAITAVKLFPQVGANFKTGTVATLYGIT